jgi:hypothetical protein
MSALHPKNGHRQLDRPCPKCANNEVRDGLGISKMVDTIAQAFLACGRRADARLTLPS